MDMERPHKSLAAADMAPTGCGQSRWRRGQGPRLRHVRDSVTAKHHANYAGHDYHFCSNGCRTKFMADPGKYLTPAPTAEPVPEGTVYTCPMHPEVRQIGPGNCPICGMALEPDLVSLDDAPNPELADMTRRFWIGLALTTPVFALEMGSHFLGLHAFMERQNSNWMQLLLATPVVLWAGWPFFERGWGSIVMRNLNMFHADRYRNGRGMGFSIVGTLAPSLFRRRSAGWTDRWRSTSRRRP